MSRVGKQPVPIPSGVEVAVQASGVTVKGPKGSLEQRLVPGVKVRVEDKEVIVERESDIKQHRALHGLYRSLINNMVVGVTQGYEKRMRVVGTGYRAEMKGPNLVLTVGYCHPVEFQVPQGIEVEVPKSTSREHMDFFIRGIDKQLVGEVAARVRRVRPPDLYKGKGIRYGDERVRRLQGKSFGSA